jgi:CBS domain-containing protein
VSRVRDAMLTDPRSLSHQATAQEAGVLLARPEVAAVLVVDDDERLLGLVRVTELVQRVVAAGRDPRATPVGELVDRNVLTIGADAPLEEAYRLMEEHDCERLPVLEGERLVGVLSRSGLQRRLAEDELPLGGDESVGAV